MQWLKRGGSTGPVSGHSGAFPGGAAHLSYNSRWVAYTTTPQLACLKFKISLARVISNVNSTVYLQTEGKKKKKGVTAARHLLPYRQAEVSPMICRTKLPWTIVWHCTCLDICAAKLAQLWRVCVRRGGAWRNFTSGATLKFLEDPMFPVPQTSSLAICWNRLLLLPDQVTFLWTSDHKKKGLKIKEACAESGWSHTHAGNWMTWISFPEQIDLDSSGGILSFPTDSIQSLGTLCLHFWHLPHLGNVNICLPIPCHTKHTPSRPIFFLHVIFYKFQWTAFPHTSSVISKVTKFF